MTKQQLEDYLAEGLSLEQIGKRVGRNASTISYHLKKHGLRPVGKKYAAKGPIDRELLEQMVKEKLPLRQMAKRVGRNKSSVRHWLIKNDLWPLPGDGRRAEAKRAQQRGDRHVELQCLKHGRSRFVLEGRGYYRCTRCRGERVSERRRRVKRLLVEEAGGACLLCGYDKCLAALEFHHLDPESKLFALSHEGITRSLEEARAEARKCTLLCSNCHVEVEHGITEIPEELLPEHLRQGGGRLKRAA